MNFFAEIIAAIDYVERPHIEVLHPFVSNNQSAKDAFFENRGLMEGFVPEQSIIPKLDAMIKVGVTFDVAEDQFEITGGERLTEAERRYLILNEREVLCALHQILLIKYLFYGSAELLEKFALDIYERESIITEETGIYTYEAYFQAVREVAQKWFAVLLDSN